MRIYKPSARFSSEEDIRLTVANDSSVDDEGQQGLLVGSSVVLQQRGSVVVADGGVCGTLGEGRANSRREGKSSEKHACDDMQELGEDGKCIDLRVVRM